jgi:T5SS/PEP-CTERM-associated repeat protein
MRPTCLAVCSETKAVSARLRLVGLSPSKRYRIVVLALCAVSFPFCGAVHAQVLWNNPSGGDFHTSGNWSTSSTPTSNDVAYFNLDSLGYSVTVTEDVALARLIVATDDVTLNLGGNTLNLLSTSEVSLRIGDQVGDAGVLTLTSGTVKTNSLGVASAGGPATGVLEISGPNATIEILGDAHENEIGGYDNEHGSLLISAGGKLSAPISILLFGRNGGAGKAQISGEASLLEAGELYVGLLGHGELEVTDGGVAHTKHLAIANQGDHPTGSVFVGQGSGIVVDGLFLVGHSGNGSLTVDGGYVDVGSQFQVGSYGPAIGKLEIRNGGVVTSIPFSSTNNNSGVVGVFDSTAHGSVRVTNQGSRWIQTGSFNVGSAGSAALQIDDQGYIECLDAQIARLDTASAEVLVDGAGSHWHVKNRLMVGGAFLTKGGTATIDVTNGGKITVGERLHLWNQGEVDLSEGGLIEVGDVSMPAALGTLQVGQGGVLSGTGTIIGDVLINGGMLSPGVSPGTLVVDGHLTLLEGSSLTLEIGGDAPSLYDRIIVGGTLTLGGELIVRFLDGYIPPPEMSHFPLIVTSTIGSPSFDNVRFENIDPALVPASWSDGSFAIQVVPEPSTALLAYVMTAALILMRYSSGTFPGGCSTRGDRHPLS